MREKKGVICGSDQSLEWMLPWWWSRYKEHNDFPVTFCDFGMSEQGRQWCKERGELVEVQFDSRCVAPREQISCDLVSRWEAIYGKGLWTARPIWFKKPSAFLLSPYERTVWIDLDCEILTSIAPLFDFCTSASQLGIVRDFLTSHFLRFDPRVAYNSGVVVFEKQAPILHKWVKGAMELNHLFWGDDPLLAHLIGEMKLDVVEIPEEWNWRMSQGFNFNASIIHWPGPAGKEYIRDKGGVKPLLNEFYRSIGRSS